MRNQKFEYMCFFKGNFRTSFLRNFDSPSEFRDWKLEGDQGNTLRILIVSSNTVLPISAECQRGFSACNDRLSDQKQTACQEPFCVVVRGLKWASTQQI